MVTLSLLPIWIIDFFGAIALLLLAGLCLKKALALVNAERESPLAIFFLWFCGAIFTLALSRSVGHMLKHLLVATGNKELWQLIAPYSGSINTMAFIVIAAVTLFYDRIDTIMNRMVRDNEKIEKNSQALLRLNKDIEAVIAERTRASMALRIAHEVRNPITIIGGMVRRLLNAYPNEKEGKIKLAHILDQSRKLENLVGKFETVRPEARKIFAALDLNQIVDESVELLQKETTPKDLGLLFFPSAEPLLFHGNASLIKMAIVHLLRNAVTACGKSGMIRVRTKMIAGGGELTISDNGPGIAPDLLEVIFDPYLRLHRQATGLGLPYVKQIVTEHMGSIAIQSEEGKGTTVVIVLPSHLGELRGSAGALLPS